MQVTANKAGDTWLIEHDGMVDYLDHAPTEAEKNLFMTQCRKQRERSAFLATVQRTTLPRTSERKTEQDYR